MDIEERMGLLISRYMDNELSEEETRLVENHTLVCAPCRDALEIYKKNEKILNSTLCGEIFENVIIDNVMKGVHKKKKTVGGKKFKAWKPILALVGFAAAVVIVTIISYMFSVYGNVQNELRRLSFQSEDILRQRDELYVKYNDLLKKETANIVRNYLSNSGHDIAGYVYGDGVVIQAKFDNLDQIYGFNVYRRVKGQLYWQEPLNQKPLIQPEYFDVSPSNQTLYEYKFTALDKNSKAIKESPVSVIKHPGKKFKEDECLKITCTDAGPDNKSAKLLITRYVDGKPRTTAFECRVGSVIGDTITDYQTGGTLDFNTNMILLSIEDAEQVITIKPAIKRDNKTELLSDVPLSFQRTSKKLTLKQANGTTSLELWRDGFLFVPINQ